MRPGRPRSGSDSEKTVIAEAVRTRTRTRTRMSPMPMRAVDPFLRKSPGLPSFDMIHPVSRRNFLPGTPA
jgi:hypothetical protein